MSFLTAEIERISTLYTCLTQAEMPEELKQQLLASSDQQLLYTLLNRISLESISNDCDLSDSDTDILNSITASGEFINDKQQLESLISGLEEKLNYYGDIREEYNENKEINEFLELSNCNKSMQIDTIELKLLENENQISLLKDCLSVLDSKFTDAQKNCDVTVKTLRRNVNNISECLKKISNDFENLGSSDLELLSTQSLDAYLKLEKDFTHTLGNFARKGIFLSFVDMSSCFSESTLDKIDLSNLEESTIIGSVDENQTKELSLLFKSLPELLNSFYQSDVQLHAAQGVVIKLRFKLSKIKYNTINSNNDDLDDTIRNISENVDLAKKSFTEMLENDLRSCVEDNVSLLKHQFFDNNSEFLLKQKQKFLDKQEFLIDGLAQQCSRMESLCRGLEYEEQTLNDLKCSFSNAKSIVESINSSLNEISKNLSTNIAELSKQSKCRATVDHKDMSVIKLNELLDTSKPLILTYDQVLNNLKSISNLPKTNSAVSKDQVETMFDRLSDVIARQQNISLSKTFEVVGDCNTLLNGIELKISKLIERFDRHNNQIASSEKYRLNDSLFVDFFCNPEKVEEMLHQ